MNYNILSYIIYLAGTLFVILWVGGTLYRNGKPFLLMCLDGDQSLAAAINKMLITGYYLLNIGYAIITLKIWEKISTPLEFVNVLAYKLGLIVLILGIMHFINVSVLLARRGRILPAHREMIKKDTNQ
jgi:hypothetical protein